MLTNALGHTRFLSVATTRIGCRRAFRLPDDPVPPPDWGPCDGDIRVASLALLSVWA